MAVIWSTLEKILLLLFLIGVGVYIKARSIVTDQGEHEISTLVVDVLWPALAFSSIVETLTLDDIIRNRLLPVLAVITCLTGLFLGSIAVRAVGWEGDRRKVFLYHATINNFVFMVLPFASAMLPGKGPGLLFIHNLGILIVIWTVGVIIWGGSGNKREMLRLLLSPGLIATAAGIVCVVTGIGEKIPALLKDTAGTLGNATFPLAMIIAGFNVYKLGRKALVFDLWNILLGILRLILVPGLLLVVTVLLNRFTNISRDSLIIFMLVNLMPVSVNSVGMAIRYGSSPLLAAQGVVFTHIFAIPTVVAFIYAMKYFL